MTIWVWKISPRLHLHPPMTQPYKNEFTLEPNDHVITKNLPETSPASDDPTIWKRVHLAPNDHIWRIYQGLHMPPMTQPFGYEFTLEPNDHMIMKNLSETSPKPDDSTNRMRVHLRTKWPYYYEKISPRLHLRPMTQLFGYEITLEPNDHMIMKNLPETSPVLNDSIIRIRVHLRIKWPYDYEKPSRDFTCIRLLNLAKTSSP